MRPSISQKRIQNIACHAKPIYILKSGHQQQDTPQRANLVLHEEKKCNRKTHLFTSEALNDDLGVLVDPRRRVRLPRRVHFRRQPTHEGRRRELRRATSQQTRRGGRQRRKGRGGGERRETTTRRERANADGHTPERREQARRTHHYAGIGGGKFKAVRSIDTLLEDAMGGEEWGMCKMRERTHAVTRKQLGREVALRLLRNQRR